MFVSHVAVSEQRKSLYNESARPVLPDYKFSIFAPHHLSVQKVETHLIMQNCAQVSPPPAKRIMTLSAFTER